MSRFSRKAPTDSATSRLEGSTFGSHGDRSVPIRSSPVADADRPWLRVMTARGKRRVRENRANPGGEDWRANIDRKSVV